MTFYHYLLLILAILPITYKFSFWLFVIQLKEYRWDRLKEYLLTPQWNRAVVNFWFVIEIILFFSSFVIFVNKPFEFILYNVVFYFLCMQNLFIFRKILTRKFITPIFTGRMYMNIFLLLLFLRVNIFIIIYFQLNTIIYTFILSLLLFSPVVIFFIILLTYPIVVRLKNKTINNAINKSIRNKDTIKIWITWSYWKTSIKEYIASILSQDGETLYTPKNVNTEMWVSKIVLNKLSKKYKYFVAEMWAYKIWEIEILWKIVDHKYWFLTAIWNQHLWLFWSQYNIQQWKSEIANSVLKNKWKLYINRNDKFIRKIEFAKKLDIVKYWSFRWSDAEFSILHTKEWITEFTFEYNQEKSKFCTDLIWKHNIINLTWVIACCYDIWLKTEQIETYLKNIKAPKNTLALIKHEKYTLIDDSYNLSEDWLYAWLDAINSFNWTKVLVIDDILELWKSAEEIHHIIWKFLANKSNIDKVLFCWANYKKAFEKWLSEWWFDMRNILTKLDNVEENSIILFEGRWSKVYLDKLTKNG